MVRGDLEFSGQVRKDSLLLTLGNYAQFLAESTDTIDPFRAQSLDQMYDPLVSGWTEIELGPQQFILVAAAEYLRLDDRHYALMSTLSHVARLGLIAHGTSFFIDRGYQGHVTFEIYNLTTHTIVLRQKMPFAKLIVFRHEGLARQGAQRAVEVRSHYGKPDQLRSRFFDEFREPLLNGGEMSDQT